MWQAGTAGSVDCAAHLLDKCARFSFQRVVVFCCLRAHSNRESGRIPRLREWVSSVGCWQSTSRSKDVASIEEEEQQKEEQEEKQEDEQEQEEEEEQKEQEEEQQEQEQEQEKQEEEQEQ